MALSVTAQASPLATTLVEETAATATMQANVTGSSGSLYMAEVDNTNGTQVYLKLWDSAAPTLGATAADYVFRIPAGTRRAVPFPGGLAFTNAFSFAVTLNAAESDTTAAASTTLVRLAVA